MFVLNRKFSRLLSCLFACVFFTFGAMSSANAYVRFTTESLGTNAKVYFSIAANGTYQVDCEKGSLYTNGSCNGSSEVSGRIYKSDNSRCVYYCQFSKYSSLQTSHTRNIDIYPYGNNYSNAPTSYNPNYSTISFYVSTSNSETDNLNNAAYIESISTSNGTLSSVFPMKGTSSGQYPVFIDSFRGTDITTIPSDLFNGYAGGDRMFEGTFAKCKNLQSVPSTLFQSVTRSAQKMFYQTFYQCSTNSSSGLTSLPVFFSNAGSSVTGQAQMFFQTFYGSRIQSLPDGLYKVSSAANQMFYQTFYGCSGYSSYIPPTYFSGLIAVGSPNTNNLMYQTFYNSSLLTSCPSGTSQYITGYEGTPFGGKVSCAPTSDKKTVTYNCNGGSGSASDTAFANTLYKTKGDICTRNGYSFANNWAVGSASSSTKINADSTVTWTYGNTTLYAQWTQSGYTLSYSCNGGSGSPSSQTVNYNTSFTSHPSTVCSRTGYTFYRWNFESNGSGTSVTANTTTTYPYQQNKTLYAQWNPNSYTLSYSCNGGSGSPSNQAVYYNTSFTSHPSSVCSRTGYTFSGWNFASNGSSTSVAANTSTAYPYAQSKTLYAQWNPNSYTLSYSCNGGSGSPSSQTVYYNTSFTSHPSSVCSRPGYTLSGWNFASNGSGTSVAVNASTTYPYAQSMILYAQWTGNTVPLTWYNGDTQLTVSNDAQSCGYGGTLTLPTPPNPPEPGLVFDGWTILN